MRRAVITGVGVIAPSGLGVQEHWEAMLNGEQRVGTISSFDASGYGTQLAGQVRGFEPADYIDGRIIVQTDRWSWFSLAAAQLALRDGDYDPGAHDPYETGVILASGSGGNEFGQREISGLWEHGPSAVGAYQSIAWFYAASTGQISIEHQAKGPSGVLVAEAAGGLDSIAQARRVIRRGTGAVLAGGTEAGITPYALTCQMSNGRLTTATLPEQGYKPFDVTASGYAPGEGGAVLLVEDAVRAAARCAPNVYGEIAGYGATHDAHDHHHAAPDCRYYELAMRKALEDAGLAPEDIDVVYADGAGTADLDTLEVTALRNVFGHRAISVPVTAPQGVIGRLSAGGSAINVVNALLSLRDGMIPAVGNLNTPIASDGLDLMQTPRDVPVRVAMINSRGYGGFNSSLIVRAAS